MIDVPHPSFSCDWIEQDVNLFLNHLGLSVELNNWNEQERCLVLPLFLEQHSNAERYFCDWKNKQKGQFSFEDIANVLKPFLKRKQQNDEPVIQFFVSFAHLYLPIADFQELNRATQKIMVGNGEKHPLASKALLYLPRKVGGRVSHLLRMSTR